MALTWTALPVSAADRGPIEICDNLSDDDGDGAVDEAACRISETSTPTSGNGIVPELWGDNPNCSDLGYRFGFKIDGCPSGTYTLESANGDLTGGAPEDPGSEVTIVCYNGTEARLVDGSSNLSMDAVFIKGGPTGGNAYNYDPEATADTGLSTPGTASAISHVEFC